jgi:hypothetical protein
MFLVREIYFSQIGFIANALLTSLSTLVIASWRMKVRGVTWKQLGLAKPTNLATTLMHTVIILVTVVATIITFEVLKDQLPFVIAPDTSNESAVSKFGALKGNFALLLGILPFIWIESFLEELLDRGFMMNWFEGLFSKTSINIILAVLIQAAIFGFRHSYDLSARSITVGLIGLVMGIAYYSFGRNLWPLIIAHCVLNTMSMLERAL